MEVMAALDRKGKMLLIILTLAIMEIWVVMGVMATMLLNVII